MTAPAADPLLDALQDLNDYDRTHRIELMYQDTGRLRRGLYRPHTAFFAAGARYRERCALAANRIGKTEGMGGYETALHLTGLYPRWWEGRRWDRGVKAWACGKTNQTLRDIGQEKLLGPPGSFGTGLIPQECIIGAPKRRAGSIPDAIESVAVRHASGGTSRLTFKSYEQGRQSFEGVEQDVIWLDEECPMGIYGECLIRTMATRPGDPGGIVMLTFTPLQGLTDVVLQFLQEGEMPQENEVDGRYVINATWDDAPHLSEAEKADLLAATPPHLRDARTKGIPHLGAGAIYPIDPEEFVIDPFGLPHYWPRFYILDVGWNRTAALWVAWDREQDVFYLYSEHYRAHAEPAVHAAAVKARGEWIPGLIDPAARGRQPNDGSRLLDDYIGLGLHLTPSANAVEAGIYEVWEMISTGRLKVFRSLTNWLMEYRLYRRDEKGKVVKERDHLMDCTRYGVLSGRNVAMVEPIEADLWDEHMSGIGRNTTTGY
jgi:phage terminase large subunit-like protein